MSATVWAVLTLYRGFKKAVMISGCQVVLPFALWLKIIQKWPMFTNP